MTQDDLYATIVVDPPWHYETGKWPENLEHRTTGGKFTRNGLPYDTMSIAEISDLAIPAAPDSHLYLWTTNRYLRDAFDVVDAWGFNFSTVLTWAKPLMGMGMGGAYSLTSEHIIFARRGSLPLLSRWPSTWFEAPRGRHSEKPDAFMDIVEQVSPGPRLEMFSRRQRMGWDVWGDQSMTGGKA